jgi:uncharacterized protein
LDGVFHQTKITETVKEVCIISYEYISQTPRLYSQYFAGKYPGIYDVLMYDAGGATSAAPIYFDPKILITPNGTNEYLIDGGVVENNPAMFAISLNNDIIGDTRPIRMISIGTGASKAKDVDAADFSGLDWWL